MSRIVPIADIEQIRALESPVRQEILDIVQGQGPCGITEIAGALRRPRDGLYYHARRLVRVGLLHEAGKRSTNGCPEVLYATRGQRHLIRYDPASSNNADAVTRVARSMLRVAERDFRSNFRSRVAVGTGPERNLWAARTVGWVTKKDLREINSLLNRLLEVLENVSSGADSVPVALTWALSPTGTVDD